ncbi:MAG: protein phosphatase 2C domain-containing protein [Blastocatellia bacterium]
MSQNIITTSVVGITDIGLVRSNNEDCLLISDPYTGQYLSEDYQNNYPVEYNRLLVAVSDGMGGAEGGEIASKLTTYMMQSELPRLPRRLSPQSRLSAAIEEANTIVREERKADSRLHAMGATITAVLIEQDMAYIAEVGDSRAYIMRNGRLKQLTTDQTMIQVMLDSGMITPQAAANSANRNILLQSIGGQEYLQVAVNAIELKRDDLFLLCSDGLSGKISTEDMTDILNSGESLNIVAKEMVELAKERGGEDNISVILVRLTGEGLKPHSQETLSRAIKILSRFDPEQEAQPKAKLLTRPATFEDWVQAAVVDYYAHTQEQRDALETLTEFGDYLVCRRGDTLTVSLEPMSDTIYCLVSGSYRLEVETLDKRKQTIAIVIAPTDKRADEEIQMTMGIEKGLGVLWVKRQFFIGSVGFFGENITSATLWCEDEENVLLQVPQRIYLAMGNTLGDRFLTAIRYS